MARFMETQSTLASLLRRTLPPKSNHRCFRHQVLPLSPIQPHLLKKNNWRMANKLLYYCVSTIFNVLSFGSLNWHEVVRTLLGLLWTCFYWTFWTISILSLLHFLRPSRKNQNHLFLLESLFRSPNSCDLLCQAVARHDPLQSHYWPDDADATTPADGWPTLTCYRDAAPRGPGPRSVLTWSRHSVTLYWRIDSSALLCRWDMLWNMCSRRAELLAN